MASSSFGTRAFYSTLTVSTNEPVVSVDWLHANLKEPDLKVQAFIANLKVPYIVFIPYSRLLWLLLLFFFLGLCVQHLLQIVKIVYSMPIAVSFRVEMQKSRANQILLKKSARFIDFFRIWKFYFILDLINYQMAFYFPSFNIL